MPATVQRHVTSVTWSGRTSGLHRQIRDRAEPPFPQQGRGGAKSLSQVQGLSLVLSIQLIPLIRVLGKNSYSDKLSFNAQLVSEHFTYILLEKQQFSAMSWKQGVFRTVNPINKSLGLLCARHVLGVEYDGCSLAGSLTGKGSEELLVLCMQPSTHKGFWSFASSLLPTPHRLRGFSVSPLPRVLPAPLSISGGLRFP